MKLIKFANVCFVLFLALSLFTLSGCGSNDSDTPAVTVAPIVVLTKMNVKTGQETAAKTAIVNFVTETHKEAGVISYDVYQGNGTEDHTFWFREVWKDAAAISTHFGTTQFGTLVTAAPSLFNVQFTGGDGTPQYFIVTTQTTTASAKSLLTGAVAIEYFKAKTGKDVEAQTLLTTLAQSALTQTGNVSFDLFKYEANYGMPEGTYQTFSKWQGSNAYDTYLASTAYTTFKTQSAALSDTDTATLATMFTTPKTLALKAEQIADPQPLSVESKNTLKEYVKKMAGQ